MRRAQPRRDTDRREWCMDMPQIIPAFGQAQAHLAYHAAHNGNGFETVFPRPVNAQRAGNQPECGLRAATAVRRLRSALIWAALASAMAVPVVVATRSPLLAWRDRVYIAAGFAGVVALILLFLQPLLLGSYLPRLRLRLERRLHGWVGVGIVAAVLVHVGALWVTSPPVVVDALLLQSETECSAWGMVAMWAAFATALLAALRGLWKASRAWLQPAQGEGPPAS